MAFLAIGAPALLVALVVKKGLNEPRSVRPVESLPDLPQVFASNVLKCLWHNRASRHLSVAVILFFTMSLGLAPWYASFMMRTHGMRTEDLGLWLGIIFGIGG